MRYPMITGHTGNDDTNANSVESLEKSISLGADAFEVDVRRDGNSVLVLSHNKQSQAFYDTCPRLSEVFEIAARHPDICINCDLKEDGLPMEVASLAAGAGLGRDRLILTGLVTPSFIAGHPEVVGMAEIYMNAENILENRCFALNSGEKAQELRNMFYDNPWRHIKRNIPGIEPYVGVLIEECRKSGVKGLNIPYAALTDNSMKEFRKNGIPVSVWTVNDEREMARMFSYGVENLTTLRVSAARSVRKSLFGF